MNSRIRLRELSVDDSSLLYEWINTEAVVKLMNQFRFIPRGDHDLWMASALLKRADRLIQGIEVIDGSVLIGTYQLVNINSRDRNAEVQIRIGNQQYLNSGYGTEALGAICEYAANELHLKKIYAYVFAKNTRSLKAFKKTGFFEEGLLTKHALIDSELIDLVIMSKFLNEK